MRKITLLLGMALTASVGFSQVVVDILSAPSCPSIEGGKVYRYAGELDGSSTDWNCPNMFLGSNSVTAECMLVDDGFDGTIDAGGSSPHIKNEDACDSATWTQDLTGKIAVFFRGACEFGLKGFNAQKRGAIAAIIINHSGDAVGMAGGAFGTNVNIPYFMISETDGNALADCLRGGGSVTAFLGSKVGVYPNDMGTANPDLLMPEQLAMPKQFAEAGEFAVDLGIWAYNLGQNPMNGVTVTADVYMGATMLHTVTSAPLNFNAPDTSFVDSQAVDLGTYDYGGLAWPTGGYSVTYTINTPVTDDSPADNMFTIPFRITDGVYAKSRVDASETPIATTAYSLNESTTLYDDWEPCIQLKRPSYTNDGSLMAESMTFSCEPVGGTMSNEIIEVRLYQWTDAFADLNDDVNYPGTTWTVVQLTSGLYFYLDESEDGVMVTVPFDTPIAINAGGAYDDQRLLACVYNSSDSLRVGFDAQIDYTTTVNSYLEASGPIKILPNGSPAEWYAAGFGYDVSPAISLNFGYPVGQEELTTQNTLLPYPNPASNMLRVPVRKGVEGKVTIEVMDVTGKVVLSENNTIGNEPLRINVASIANGSYFFKLTFADGTVDTFKVSVNR